MTVFFPSQKGIVLLPRYILFKFQRRRRNLVDNIYISLYLLTKGSYSQISDLL